jgi:hypothetical protein
MPLSHEQQLALFGMTTAEACALRDRVQAALGPKAVAEARAAWSDMAADLRAWHAHPEAVRLRLLQALADGHALADAMKAARSSAQLEN